jgi:hypothetical protein
MKAVKTLEGGWVAPKIIGALPLRVSAAQRVGLVDLGMSRYQVSSNAKGAPCHNKRRDALQADAGARVGLTGVVMPQKRSKASRSWDNRQKKRADNVLDDKAESALPVGEHAQRLAKKAETEGRVLPAAETGHAAVGMGAKVKEIEEIDLEELDDKGAQAQVVVERAGKTEKSSKTKRQALMPVKKDHQTVGAGAKANNGMGGN